MSAIRLPSSTRSTDVACKCTSSGRPNYEVRVCLSVGRSVFFCLRRMVLASVSVCLASMQRKAEQEGAKIFAAAISYGGTGTLCNGLRWEGCGLFRLLA